MILVTGASGFVGSGLVRRLVSEYMLGGVVAALRYPSNFTVEDGVKPFFVGNLLPTTDWTSALVGIDSVVHCAARVHVMKDETSDPMSEYRKVNVQGTLNLAQQAADAGVRRFIFISSIKVNGESTFAGHSIAADDKPSPLDAYGISKWEAEQGLHLIAEKSGMEVTIVRPPLIYGPGVKANFRLMMSWLQRGIPLPLGGITNNRRSFVFIDNLVDLIIVCINHPSAANQTFLVSDDEDLSTAELLDNMALALGSTSRLIAFPTSLIELGAKLIGRSDIAQRLCSSLQVDIKKTKELLDWAPPVSVKEGLSRTATYLLKMKS